MTPLAELLVALDGGGTFPGGSPLHETMHRVSQEALRLTVELNGGYHEPSRVCELLTELTGRPIAEAVTAFPPPTTGFGKNLTIGERVFVNSGCRFQDPGGITIGDNAVVAAASVVPRDVPADALVVGSPARARSPTDAPPGASGYPVASGAISRSIHTASSSVTSRRS
ncbi:hypothetical protein [Pseudactinotalea sp. HY158]|uniref:hypothetical protein n=1 Tax=unclassified Pseudactinotalea TaxID=2649176 RepID=UPI00351A0BE6